MAARRAQPRSSASVNAATNRLGLRITHCSSPSRRRQASLRDRFIIEHGVRARRLPHRSSGIHDLPFDKEKALAALAPLEEPWGGTLRSETLGSWPRSGRPRGPQQDFFRDHSPAPRSSALAVDLHDRRIAGIASSRIFGGRRLGPSLAMKRALPSCVPLGGGGDVDHS